ncbi:MAG: cytochrome b/b6 domain-containing protein [Gammaproteobacteria bacterium]|nr:cytochrome b/b6 domain-containing protein [Gammaproteobacteria bacterium]
MNASYLGIPKATRYSSRAIALHWIVAVLVVVVGVLGLLHDSWPKTTQAYWINLHALLGLLLWGLLWMRLAWRRGHPPPDLPADAGTFARRLSYPVHLLLYLLLFVIPILGIVTFVWHGRAFNFGIFRIDFGVARNPAIFRPTEDIHGYLAYVLFGLAGVHALAALWHQFVRRDGLLLRMWPPGG